MYRLDIAVLVVLLMLVSACTPAIIGWGDRCYQSTGVSSTDPDILTATPDCDKGSISWHYPQYTKGGLKINWNTKPGSKICITDKSQIDLISRRATDLSGQTIDLTPLSYPSTDDTAKVCVRAGIDGKQRITLYSDVWTYVQYIEYTVEQA